uniref:Uncharacterized protein n=1 Tax=Amphimedon queenslandica TaxID=400682 RepID=A0A1X7T5E9_AMPQE
MATSNAHVTTANDSSGELDDETIIEGDEHLLTINGGPAVASLLSLENPETENNILLIAPGEGQKPLSIMCDANFELMSNPEKFPFGSGGFNTERITSLTYRKYFNQRLLNVDGCFSSDLDYLFCAQYIVESNQILDDANNYIWRQWPYDSGITAAQARDPRCLKEYIRKDKAYCFMKNVRGSPPYYQRTFYDLLAM